MLRFLEIDCGPDGNVWDEEQYRKEFFGWRIPEDDSDEAVLDQTLLNTLYSLVDIIPIPKEHEDASTVA